MAFNNIEKTRYAQVVDAYIQSRRPPPHLRDQLDLSFCIQDQSIVIFELRAVFHQPGLKIESPVAKTTYVRTQNHWKLFWMRQDLKWHGYEPHLFSDTLEQALAVVGADQHACFWG